MTEEASRLRAVRSVAGGVFQEGYRASRLKCFLLAVFTVLVAFPDVIFFNASIRPVTLLAPFSPPEIARSFYPESEARLPADGYSDIEAIVWQVEPAHAFLRDAMRNLESPYWNPYSAAGTLGPEILSSSKFSLASLAIAVAGATSFAFHFVHLSIFVVSLYCLARTLSNYLGRSLAATAAGCLFFILNGFHVASLCSQVAQPYVFAPVLLHLLLKLSHRASVPRFISAVLANGLVLAETFVPTTALVMITVHCLAAAYTIRRYGEKRTRLTSLAVQGLTPAVGLALLAPLWLPAVEGLAVLNTWERYSTKNVAPFSFKVLLSAFSPMHFWESYRGYFRHDWFADLDFRIGRYEAFRVYHMGMVPVLLGTHAWNRRSSGWHPVVIVAFVLAGLAFGRTFGIPPFSLLGKIPVFTIISIQYWAVMLALSWVVILPYGVDALSKKTACGWPVLTVLVVICLSAAYLAHEIGMPKTERVANNLTALVAILALAMAVFLGIRLAGRGHGLLKLAIVALLTGELVFYMNTKRAQRRELAFSETNGIGYLLRQKSLSRVLNIGFKGLPPNWGSALRIPQAGSIDESNLPWYADFFRRTFGLRRASRFLVLRNVPDGISIDDMNLLGICHVVVARRSWDSRIDGYPNLSLVFEGRRDLVYENRDCFPRAFPVPALLQSAETPGARGMSARDVAFTEDEELLRRAESLGIPTVHRGDPAIRYQDENSVRILSYENARVELEAVLGTPSVIVLSDTWHPNWRANSNGNHVHLGLVNEAFRGVALAAGRHVVELTYSPRTLRPAFAVSAAAVAGLLALILSRRRLASRYTQPSSRP